MRNILFYSFIILFPFSVFAQSQKSVQEVKIVSLKDTINIFGVVEVEASYPGGLEAWRHYLYQNLKADAPFKDLPKKVKFFEQTAIVQFIVDKDGSISDVKVINEVLPSIRKEAERVIKKSGKWEPAIQNGRKVKAYRKQPITFVVTGD